MLEESRHGLPQPDSPRYRAMRRQCKRLISQDRKPSNLTEVLGSLSGHEGGCPCETLSECRFQEEHASQDAIADAMALSLVRAEFNKAIGHIASNH